MSTLLGQGQDYRGGVCGLVSVIQGVLLCKAAMRSAA